MLILVRHFLLIFCSGITLGHESKYVNSFVLSNTDVERIVTPETSYESLVAMQCAEIEDAMMNEVQRFYIAWNKKLEELKKRNGGQLGGNELSVMGMGLNSGEMRSM